MPSILDNILLKIRAPGLKSTSAKRRLNAVWHISNLDARDSNGYLVAALSDSDREVRSKAAKYVVTKKISDPQAVEPLLRILEEEFSSPRPLKKTELFNNLTGEIIARLGELRDARAVEPLIVMLEQNQWASQVVPALGAIGDTRAMEPLAKYFITTSHDHAKAARALSAFGTKSLQVLIPALESSQIVVRKEAASALGLIKDPRAVEPLVRLLHDPDNSVRTAAALALDLIGWKPANENERVSSLIARGRFDEVAKLGEVAVRPLVELLGSSSVRAEIAEVLGKIGNAEAIPSLVNGLNDEPTEAGVERILTAIRRLGGLSLDDREYPSSFSAAATAESVWSGVLPTVPVLSEHVIRSRFASLANRSSSFELIDGSSEIVKTRISDLLTIFEKQSGFNCFNIRASPRWGCATVYAAVKTGGNYVAVPTWIWQGSDKLYAGVDRTV